MESVLLIFPDVTSIMQFILEQNANGVEVNTLETSIMGELPHNKIDIAINKYGAFVKQRFVEA